MKHKNSFKAGQRTTKNPVNKWFILAGVATLILVATIAILELTNTTYLLHDEVASSGTIPSDISSESNNEDSAESSSTDTEEDSNNTTPEKPKNTSTTTSSDLIEPFGNFVSNHRVVLSDPASTQQQSLCNTTPGATCYIKFTKGSAVRELEAQTANENGVAAWSWDVKKSGLTTGEWLVTAVTKLGDQQKTAEDSIKLEVQS